MKTSLKGLKVLGWTRFSVFLWDSFLLEGTFSGVMLCQVAIYRWTFTDIFTDIVYNKILHVFLSVKRNKYGDEME